jgi:hypothetical protein
LRSLLAACDALDRPIWAENITTLVASASAAVERFEAEDQRAVLLLSVESDLSGAKRLASRIGQTWIDRLERAEESDGLRAIEGACRLTHSLDGMGMRDLTATILPALLKAVSKHRRLLLLNERFAYLAVSALSLLLADPELADPSHVAAAAFDIVVACPSALPAIGGVPKSCFGPQELERCCAVLEETAASVTLESTRIMVDTLAGAVKSSSPWFDVSDFADFPVRCAGRVETFLARKAVRLATTWLMSSPMQPRAANRFRGVLTRAAADPRVPMRLDSASGALRILELPAVEENRPIRDFAAELLRHLANDYSALVAFHVGGPEDYLEHAGTSSIEKPDKVPS